MFIPITQLDVSAYTIPTDRPEADGTIEWNSTTIVIVQVIAGDHTGLGFTYGDLSAARIVDRVLSPLVLGTDAMAVAGQWMTMLRAVRNMGRPGIASHAISAVDIALWDLKARLMNVPLFKLLGSVRQSIPVYGSGGFTSYSIDELQTQLSNWVEQGITKVKMKVGARPADDLERVRAAKQAIGGNATYSWTQMAPTRVSRPWFFAENFAAYDVAWFEEPVSSDDLDGLRLIRNRAPAGMNISAGEYGYDPTYFRRMLEAGAVDVVQADATRCGGFSGFLEVAALADAFHIPISAHTAPSIHAHVSCSVPAACHLEYFHDHVLIERMLFDNVLEPVNGSLFPDPGSGGHGAGI